MSTLYKLLINLMIFGIVIYTFNGASFVEGLFSLILGGAIFALVMYGVDPILAFFKFPKNFWGYLIIATLFSLIYFAVLNSLLTGIVSFGVGSVGGDFGPIALPATSLESQMMTVIFTAIYAALLSIIFEQLESKS